jgi:ABC-type nickel/cobalt efflux system permease component RcnA
MSDEPGEHDYELVAAFYLGRESALRLAFRLGLLAAALAGTLAGLALAALL